MINCFNNNLKCGKTFLDIARSLLSDQYPENQSPKPEGHSKLDFLIFSQMYDK